MSLREKIRYGRWNPMRAINQALDKATEGESLEAQVVRHKERWSVISEIFDWGKALVRKPAAKPQRSFEEFAEVHRLSAADVAGYATHYTKIRTTYWIVAAAMTAAAMLFAFTGAVIQFTAFIMLAALAGINGLRYGLEAWRFGNRSFGSFKDYLG